MASEKAKELAAKQKAEAKAAKLRKKTSTNPSDWGAIRQLKETYRFTAEQDKRTTWFMLGGFLVPIVASTLVGYFFELWLFGLIFGILIGFSVSMLALTWLAKGAAYLKHKGQPGSGQVPLMMLPRKKWTFTPAITGDKSGTMVHRAVGAAGVILVAEGNPSKATLLISAEKRRHEQVLTGIKITTILMGDGEDQIPLERITKYITKLPRTVNKVDLADLESRLKALDSMRQKIPVPRGPLPNAKGSRRALRGR